MHGRIDRATQCARALPQTSAFPPGWGVDGLGEEGAGAIGVVLDASRDHLAVAGARQEGGAAASDRIQADFRGVLAESERTDVVGARVAVVTGARAGRKR